MTSWEKHSSAYGSMPCPRAATKRLFSEILHQIKTGIHWHDLRSCIKLRTGIHSNGLVHHQLQSIEICKSMWKQYVIRDSNSNRKVSSIRKQWLSSQGKTLEYSHLSAPSPLDAPIFWIMMNFIGRHSILIFEWKNESNLLVQCKVPEMIVLNDSVPTMTTTRSSYLYSLNILCSAWNLQLFFVMTPLHIFLLQLDIFPSPRRTVFGPSSPSARAHIQQLIDPSEKASLH